MSLDPFVDARKHFLWIPAPVRACFIVWSEWHIVATIRSVRLRIGKRPAIIRSLLHVDQFVRRMIINVGGNQLSIIDRTAVAPTVPKGVANVVQFVDCRPELVCPRNEIQPFRVTYTAGKN